MLASSPAAMACCKSAFRSCNQSCKSGDEGIGGVTAFKNVAARLHGGFLNPSRSCSTTTNLARAASSEDSLPTCRTSTDGQKRRVRPATCSPSAACFGIDPPTLEVGSRPPLNGFRFRLLSLTTCLGLLQCGHLCDFGIQLHDALFCPGQVLLHVGMHAPRGPVDMCSFSCDTAHKPRALHPPV